MNVVAGTLILSSADDLDNVQSMVCCTDDGGREPQASGIIEKQIWSVWQTAGLFVGNLDRHGLPHSGRHADLDGHSLK